MINMAYMAISQLLYMKISSSSNGKSFKIVKKVIVKWV